MHGFSSFLSAQIVPYFSAKHSLHTVEHTFTTSRFRKTNYMRWWQMCGLDRSIKPDYYLRLSIMIIPWPTLIYSPNNKTKTIDWITEGLLPFLCLCRWRCLPESYTSNFLLLRLIKLTEKFSSPRVTVWWRRSEKGGNHTCLRNPSPELIFVFECSDTKKILCRIPYQEFRLRSAY